MKSKAKPKTKKPGVSLFEIVLLALPFLALIPNNFIPPLLGHVGLATQEFVFACAGLVFAGLGMVQIVQAGQKQFEISREDWLMFAALSGFILWQAISLSWAPAVYDGVRVTGIWLGFAIFLIAGVICLRQRSAEWLRGALSVISVILAISVIVEPLIFGPERRGIFFNHGISAELLVTLLPFHILTYLTTEKRWLAVASLAISGLSAVALLMGLRRGALIGAAIILIAVGFAAAFKLIKPPSKTRVRIAVGLMVLAAAVVGARYRQEIVYRIQGATQLQSVEGGLTTRLRGYITAWEMGKANALIGVGAAGYPSLYGSYRQRFVSNPPYAKIAAAAGPEDFDEIRSPLVHNEYLETFVELGIVGLLLFFAFWALVARGLWRRSRNADHPMIIGSLLGLVAFGVSSFTSGFSLRYTPQAFILPCVLCVGFAFGRTGGRANDEQKPSISLPRAAATAIAALALVASAMLAARAFNVLASQRLQGRTSWAVPQLDFNFFPEHPAGNETLARRYEQVIELDSENAGAHLGYGLLLYQMKRPEKAIPHVEFALNHGYSRPFAYVLLAFAHEQAGDLARGSQVLSECAASYPQSFFVRAAYAEMLRKEGKVGQAGEQQNAMYTLNAHEAQSWELLIRKRPDEAAKEAQQRGLIPPDRLWPRLAATLVGARAFHYLK